MIATRTCGKCKQVFVTSESTCPVDGQPFPRAGAFERTIADGMPGYDAGGAPELLEKTTVANLATDGSNRINARHSEKKAAAQPAAVAPDDAKERALQSLVGQVLDNQYEIISLIGQGGMSVVYKARHNMLRKIVAIKTMLPHLMVHPFALQRFQQEAQAASNIVHTNVITIYNFGITPEGQPYLVMDYLEGTSLAEQIAKTKFLPVGRAVNIFLQVTNALAHAHRKGVIHRDLKPSNIILLDQGEKKDVVQIVDFGIAKMLPQDGEQALNLTQTGEVFGSPLYMSPEQCKGEQLDHRADVYSLGCLMYETLTGKPPLHGDNTLEVLYKHINELPHHMSDKSHPIPAKLEAIVFKALAKSPTNRYQTMDDLEQDLQSFQKLEQFSLLGIFKSRWELAQAKRLPQSKKEKIAMTSIVVALMVTAAASLYPVVSIWNLANGAESRAPLLLDDDRRAPNSQIDSVNSKAFDIALKQAEQFNDRRSGDEDIALYAALMRHGRYYTDLGMFPSAYQAFEAAVKFSTKMNGIKAWPTKRARLEIGNVQYNMGKWQEAINSFSEFIPVLTDLRRDGAEKAYYSARLGNCYWNAEQYPAAKKWYQEALNTWKLRGRDNTPGHDGHHDNHLDDNFSMALTRTRLALIYQHELASAKYDDSLTASYKKSIEEQAPALLYSALPLWRTAPVQSAKNEGICEIHLAQALETAPDVVEKIKKVVSSQDNISEADSNVKDLLNNGTELIKQGCGPESIYHAVALLKLAKYQWNQHHFDEALKTRWQACTILAHSSRRN